MEKIILCNQVLILKNTKSDIELVMIDNVTELILKISYVMIQEADPSQVNDYISFLKSIDDLYTDANWIEEVILLACTPISGRLQGNK